MFSTSSSDCDCTVPFSFHTAVPNFIGNPFCPTIRQPLIYYAKIQEPFHQQQYTGNIKDNSNCFMKAFQWYTQELGSGHRDDVASPKVDNSDFAAWLDKKYSEYLKRSRQDGPQLILKQSQTLNGDKMTKKGRSGRKFKRMRSPWKRRRHTNSKEKGDIPNINQSIEYILQPQELQKPGSECCHTNSGIESNTTVISKESPKHTKIKIESKSLLCIYRAQDAGKNKVKTNAHGKNICECQMNDKGTQYNTLSLESVMTSRKYTTISGDSKYQPYCSKMLKAGVIFNENPNSGNGTKLQNCTAQTSDHSINFGQVMYEPILLKVVHVNK